VISHDGVKAGHALHPLGHTSLAQPAAVPVSDLDVVMVLGPVITYEHLSQPVASFSIDQNNLLRAQGDQQLANGSVLPGTSSHQLSRSTSPTSRRTI
jgi:hypothetical protein